MVHACTRDCYDTCIFDDNHKPIDTFPFNGFTCSRGIADLKRNSLNRVDSVYIEGKLSNIDEALDLIVKEIRKRKKEEILHVDYDGNQGLLTWYYPARLWNVIGAASTDYSICSSEGHEAIKLHYGNSIGALPEDFLKYESFVIWGSELVFSFIHGWNLIRDKYKATIDVRISETAKRSNKYYIVKPGSDVYLAIGIIKRLFERNWADLSLLDEPEELRNYVYSFNDEEIEEATGLDSSKIDELAELYYYRRPLTIIGFALGRSINGGDAISLISLIPALIGMKKGFFYANSQGLGIDFKYLRGLHKYSPSRIVGMAEVGKEIEEGKITFMFVWNSNPLHSLPMSDRIYDAVKEGRLFLVVHDPYWSETAKIANVVLPAPTYLEKEDVVYSYWHNYLVFNKPILPKRGITEVELMRMLAIKLEINDNVIFEDEWLAIGKATGVNITELKTKGFVKLLPRYPEGKVRVKPLPEKFSKPSGNIIVFSSHPNYTNSQFKEVYGNKMVIVYNSEFDGIGYLSTNYGKVKVMFKRDPLIPRGVLFIPKSFLFDLDGKPINSIIGFAKGKYGNTPIINTASVKIIKT
ncbi:dehydrogenase [Saccharolobus solfataricus]|uniref:Dehydrogenase n=2 Tax=Saccharolobus solfataricus TaxID=2287 RepID=A0A0E3K087_SACSO|nr:molybdopterin-dependent oxidoreductase [Saccharolobus solfataricus]AKA73312.1 dehydrogenase [Saccharolobus solfataricus]AKA76011.1 dehydrogenase [Saccharolobus solfataricus]AKA78704.1 dehydrogenase [Saccharolobus solfataricus]AZF67779.1 dehydrogenase [Saccharolobus solfataricus]AZF70399.1 dehydrogenase [Saccharolobus solfataricus]